jgi:isoquinoline 1-oxidoreductase beta subunit
MFLNKPELGTTFAQLAGQADQPQSSKAADDLSMSRRGFVMATSGLTLGVVLAGCSGTDEPAPAPAPSATGPSPLTDVLGGDATPGLWIEIAEDGAVNITVHRSEMGQQVWTSMAQIVADELEANWDDVNIVQALGDPKYGDQNTDGSRSVRFNFHRLRVAGGAMRTMLEQAAANEWGVALANVRAELGNVTGPDGKSVSYGDLAKAASELAVPAEDEIKLKPREDWRYIGKNISSLTVEQITVGQGTFGIDVQMDDMVYAVVARPPHIFGKIGSLDDAAAKAVPGVLATVRLPDATPPAMFQPAGGVAIVATDTWAAIQGRNALDISWQDGPNASHTSATYDAAMMATAQKPGTVHRNRGDAAGALADAATRISADYHVASFAHSSMEPPAATAKWTDDTLECWACVQDPQSTRATLAGLLNMAPENITVNATWLGGAFGRKSKPDFVAEAAMIAKEVGKPVKVTWTREDDLGYDYFHAPSAQHLEAGLNADGEVTSWLHRSVFPTISSTFAPGANEPASGEMGLGATDTPFNIPNIRVESGQAEAGLRIGWLRSVSNNQHAFAVQSFAAELAHAAGRDQKEFLLDLIGPDRSVDLASDGANYDNYAADLSEYPIDTARLKAAAERAASMAGWGRALPERHGLGIAVHRSFLSYVATVIEVAVADDGVLTIPGIWLAVDAGTVVNPRHVKAQMEGGTIYGLSNALYGEITATGGTVDQKNFPDWRLMRMGEAPRTFEVEVMASDALPGGVGEPGTPPAAPALTNAIFAATGVRMRRLPILGPNAVRLALDTAQAT